MSEDDWIIEIALPRCEKCGITGPLHRHHLKHEILFIRAFQATPRAKTRWYKRLVKRYGEFRDHDVRLLCGECHLKIHAVYRIVVQYRFNMLHYHKNFSDYSIQEAVGLMRACREAYFKWRDGDPEYQVHEASNLW